MTTPHPHPHPHPPSRIIFLNGFPGVGKLTIARALQTKLQALNIPTRLIDNHVLIDTAQAVIPGRSPDHKALRSKIRFLVFEALAREFEKMHESQTPTDDEATSPGLTVIMTRCLTRTAPDISVFHETLNLARVAKVPIFFFNLVCGEEEHRKRFLDPERVRGGKSKCCRLERLGEHLSGERLLRMGDLEGGLGGVVVREWEVDVGGLCVGASVGVVLRLVDGPGEEG
ncbi:hypothetical protein CC80DRAFT_560826 [Byssothecium circinans]|uniref:P-loop containing nucleoside triphosphate hydrolase protein n=1 Tax=Byssothecium circinans TaxID=147558 RepID=A0A6A5TYG9_9PLEO|nr:hypothetical protein CC80DRAFT_560826 [Byssothecium circinans]